jgi:hypothetical protein
MIDKKQLQNVEYFSYLGCMIINDARGTRAIKSMIAITKAAISKNKDSFHQQIGLKFKEETSKVLCMEHCFIWC